MKQSRSTSNARYSSDSVQDKNVKTIYLKLRKYIVVLDIIWNFDHILVSAG